VYAGGGLGGTAISFVLDGLIKRLGIAWAFRVIGFITLGTGLPAAWLIKERVPIRKTAFVEWYGKNSLSLIRPSNPMIFR